MGEFCVAVRRNKLARELCGHLNERQRLLDGEGVVQPVQHAALAVSESPPGLHRGFDAPPSALFVGTGLEHIQESLEHKPGTVALRLHDGVNLLRQIARLVPVKTPRAAGQARVQLDQPRVDAGDLVAQREPVRSWRAARYASPRPTF